MEILGKPSRQDAKEIDLSGITDADAAEVAAKLALLTAPKTLVIGSESDNPLSWESLKTLHDAAPGAAIDYAFTMWKKDLNLKDEELDLKHIRMDDEGEQVRQITACMTNLKTLDMDSCGVSNEAMAALRDSMPEVEVIWRVNFGRFYTARTNTEKILASMPGKAGNLVHNNVMALQYCTKVKYMDLGHNNHLDTIEFCRYMPDLEVLIVACTFVEDFSPLAECPKLEYVEALTTRLHDLTPFSGLKNLRHLNIAYNFAVTDITPLYSLTGLERLWIGAHDPVPPEQIAEFRRLAPNCEVNDTATDPTEEHWRFADYNGPHSANYVPRYAELRSSSATRTRTSPLSGTTPSTIIPGIPRSWRRTMWRTLLMNLTCHKKTALLLLVLLLCLAAAGCGKSGDPCDRNGSRGGTAGDRRAALRSRHHRSDGGALRR